MVAAAVLIAFAGVTWSPDLQRVTSSIYTMRSDGSQRRRLTGKGNWTDTNPAWSRDRRRIAFGRYDSRGWRLFVMSTSGRDLHAVTTRRPLAEAPTWSPDGRALAFAGMPTRLPMTGSFSQQIYIVSLPSGHVRQLTPLSPFPGGAGLPAWSPSGKRIAFAAGGDIWTIHPDGTGRRRLIRNADAPAWSPDGKRLAFARDGDIYTVTLGGAVRRITRTPRLGDSEPSWCADGSRIAFATRRGEDVTISTAAAAGTGLRTLPYSDPNFWMDAPAC
jgi:Tol biopolymer transport system component